MTKLFSRTLTFAKIDSKDLIAAKFIAVGKSFSSGDSFGDVPESGFRRTVMGSGLAGRHDIEDNGY